MASIQSCRITLGGLLLSGASADLLQGPISTYLIVSADVVIFLCFLEKRYHDFCGPKKPKQVSMEPRTVLLDTY